MYATRVIEASQAKVEEAAKVCLHRYAPDESLAWAEHLSRLVKPDGEMKRALKQEEKEFIRNERLLSMVDFHYWSRYAMIQREGGGVCRFSPWESQRLLLRRLSTIEEKTWEARQRNEPVDGILLCCHKARQLGLTAVARALIMHRNTTQHYVRAFSASVDDDKIQEMYDRDKLILDNLPFYLRPEVGYDEKRTHLYFEKLGSRILYQMSSQKGGLGVSRQFDVAHLTELSTWENADRIELDFFPTLPMSPTTLVVLESIANGRGNWWHGFVTRVRARRTRRFHLVFIPWYAEITKYRAQPPEGWQPSELALLHAQKVYDTSHEYVGRQVMLTREQLYWWESTRAEYQAANKTNFFLTNWCATIEESFQHSGQSAFTAELLDWMRSHTKTTTAYDVATVGAP